MLLPIIWNYIIYFYYYLRPGDSECKGTSERGYMTSNHIICSPWKVDIWLGPKGILFLKALTRNGLQGGALAEMEVTMRDKTSSLLHECSFSPVLQTSSKQRHRRAPEDDKAAPIAASRLSFSRHGTPEACFTSSTSTEPPLFGCYHASLISLFLCFALLIAGVCWSYDSYL